MTRRNPVPPTILATLAVLLLGLAAGCGFVNPPALVLGGPPGAGDVVLSDADFRAELKVIAEDTTLTGGLAQGADPYGSAAKTDYSPAFVAAILSSHVQLQALVNEAARRNITITADELSATEKSIVGQIEQSAQGAQSPTGEAAKTVDGKATLAKLGAFRELLLRGITAQTKLQTAVAPSEDALRNAYDGAKDKLGTSACASHILIAASKGEADPQTGRPPTPTDEEYAAALTTITEIQGQLAAGGSFEQLATERSDDPGSGAKGGDLGCVSEKGKYVQSFDDAVWSQEVGEVGPPVRTEFGYHLIMVTKRGVPAFDEVKTQISDALAKEELGKATKSAFDTIKVTVDARYGTWDAAKATVQPPSGAADPTVPTTPTTAFDPSSLDLSGATAP